MIQFNLFRLHVFEGTQKALPYGDGPLARPRILGEIFASGLRSQLKKGGFWHIANHQQLSDTSHYMLIGKTVERLRQIYLEEVGEFKFETRPEAETAQVFLDIPSELLAISENTSLGPGEFVANWFVHLLMASERAVELQAVVKVDPLTDPRDLIHRIHAAHSVSKVWIELPRKNAHSNVEGLFNPVQARSEKFHAARVRLEWIAENAHLQTSEELDELLAEATSIGGTAGARLKPTKKAKPVNVGTKKNLLKTSTPDVMIETPPSQKRQILEEIAEAAEQARKARGSD